VLIWEFFFFFAGILELGLVPYTVCTDINNMLYKPDGTKETFFYLEIIIDIMWLINICLTFCTAVKKDFGMEVKFSQIAINYLTKDFIFDVLSTVPTLVTVYAVDKPYLYYFKIVRVLPTKVNAIFSHILEKIASWKSAKKQTFGYIDYFFKLVLKLILLIHIIACLWLWCGNSPNNGIDEKPETWIYNSEDGLNKD
jgi:hypothetical protein